MFKWLWRVISYFDRRVMTPRSTTRKCDRPVGPVFDDTSTIFFLVEDVTSTLSTAVQHAAPSSPKVTPSNVHVQTNIFRQVSFFLDNARSGGKAPRRAKKNVKPSDKGAFLFFQHSVITRYWKPKEMLWTPCSRYGQAKALRWELFWNIIKRRGLPGRVV